ncbi:hypothetical protein [Actinospica sp.]|uniref:hypothetical protein n=1 Tax=Actinospica sp. TaxID=1872142 RepID=UPI002CCF1AA6|nr:hypothetical protein [Actinospica sp.]HWG22679.1 hypothetical protein [Actinospica sp.]
MEAGPTRRPPAAGDSGGVRTRIKLPADPYSENVPRRSLRGPLIIGGVVVALFAVIALVNQGGKGGGSPSAAAATATTAPATASATPSSSATSLTTAYDAGQASDTADGVPVGYPHTSSGAQAAAANYVVAFNSADMVRSSVRSRLVNAIADPAIASSLEGQFDAAYAQIDNTYGLSSSGAAPAGQTYVERAAPVGVSLVSDSGDTATVSVWVVTLAGLAGTNTQHAVSEDWATVTVTLNWTHGDWKWFSFQSADGPAPLGGLQTPAAGSTLQAAVSKFGGLRYGR